MLARLRKAREEEGFTLIELLVVMIIIGILAAIAIPLFLNQRKNAIDASIKSDLRTLANEMESQYTNNQAYPAAWTAGTWSATPSSVVSAGGSATVATGDTVRVSNGNAFKAVLNSTADAFCLAGANAKMTHPWVYISSQGGLQPSTVTDCPSSF